MYNVTTIFIELCFIFLGVYWLVTSFSTKRTAERATWGDLMSRIPLIVGVLIFWLYLGPIMWHWSLVLGIVADVVTFLGLLIMLSARTTLGKNWSARIVFKENHELVDKDLYKYVRHPIYTGALVMIVGVMLNDGHLSSLILFVLIFIGFWLKAREEEKLLTKHFPQEYPAYKKRTKMLIPFIF